MLTALFVILMLVVFGKLLVFAIKASWGVIKILFTIIFLPLILIGLVIAGLTSVALPILLVIGVISLIASQA
ncbi:MAG: hypothetical protein SO445_09865 [Lachnospiraceae bacterium]|nr:hypothetical protein [Lachnospiraceae bacterium]MDD7377943.1 hypothetical protein [Lachnospiraceae bacterium]MDY4617993.1 hypothetical protein [Lachnospiraceae bacterium]